jgi:hypothetical protein
MPTFPKNQIIRSRDETFGEAGAVWDPGFGLKPQLDERPNRGVRPGVYECGSVGTRRLSGRFEF